MVVLSSKHSVLYLSCLAGTVTMQIWSY